MQPLFQPIGLKSMAVKKKNECAGKLVSDFEYEKNSFNQSHNQGHNILGYLGMMRTRSCLLSKFYSYFPHLYSFTVGQFFFFFFKSLICSCDLHLPSETTHKLCFIIAESCWVFSLKGIPADTIQDLKNSSF